MHKLYMKKIAIDRLNLQEIEEIKQQYMKAGWDNAGTMRISANYNFISFTWNPAKGKPQFPQNYHSNNPIME